jgi:xylulose-5-phosphate/fructose-6-phosphate phosphoketolase
MSDPSTTPLSPEQLQRIDAYWRGCCYLAAGMIYLRDNPLLKEPLKEEHLKKRLLGHWGASPGLAFMICHTNRIILERNQQAIFLAGPGHGAPGVLAPVYLEGTYSEIYPNKSEDEEGMKAFFKQFSFPGGIGSHCTPETPGSIHEGGELGYSISHAFGAAYDNPELLVVVAVGDGESETGPLATAWHSSKFLNAARDGAVLPILHLNGYKINNPTLLSRIPNEELASLMRGYGWEPHFVEGDDPMVMHQAMAATMDACHARIQEFQADGRAKGAANLRRYPWPMIVLRTPKGWTGPKTVDGKKVEGFWRAHQVPLSGMHNNPAHLAQLEAWMKSYKPEELFDATGKLRPEIRAAAPEGNLRMSANPHANGGLLRRALRMPDFRQFACTVDRPGTVRAMNTKPLGALLREVMRENMSNFRVFGPDENTSNKLDAIYEVSKKLWLEDYLPEDEDGGELSPDGRVMEMLSEHTLEGWYEGYVLTGRHGFFASYEAFIHVIDSMYNQHAKWLAICNEIPWRAPISSLNLLITSTVWRQDHNGFTHQDPGFLDVVVNKNPEVARIYLPPDVNCLLSVANHCLQSINYINVIVADKQNHLQYLNMDDAIKHCTKGIGIWDWASNDEGYEPDVVMVGCGAYIDNLFYIQGRFREVATPNDLYMAAAYTVRDRLLERWIKSAQTFKERNSRTVCYLSAEYLLGPHLANNMINLGITEVARQAGNRAGPGLRGNRRDRGRARPRQRRPGPARRLLHGLPGHAADPGHRLRHPLRVRHLRPGHRRRLAGREGRHLAANGNPWEIPRPKLAFPVGFGGHTEQYTDEHGNRALAGCRTWWSTASPTTPRSSATASTT